jgi:peptidyl-prolyl cis-trans isomerase A (cyclophilin A)
MKHVLFASRIGNIKIEIDDKNAPITVANFIQHIETGIYNSASFYRTVRKSNQLYKPFIDVVQGGLGLKVFDDSYNPPFKPILHESTIITGILHLNATISMSRTSIDTASSEFFICIGNQPELDFGGRRNPDGFGFAAFGKIIKGMELIEVIHKSQTSDFAPESWPMLKGQLLKDPILIDSAKVL